MIPIVYKDDKWVKADYTNKENNWYDYENQQWANIATVSESTRDAYKKANIGSEIKMEDINAMFVWIPRFKYKLFNVNGNVSPVGNPNMAGDYMIDIQLEDASTPKSKGTQNGEWLTHPAFTFGGAEQDRIDPSKVRIKPGINSWRKNQLNKMYQNARGISRPGNVFGLTNANDSHMVKNMEWGAMAYLASSQYGKAGNPTYSGLEREIRINNNYNYLTGCGADRQNATAALTCNTYETVNGMTASTTGNITGIYDTAGGAWEYVAGGMKSTSGKDMVVSTTGFDQTELNQIAITGKYLDVYEYGTIMQDRNRGHLGDATIETGPFDGNERNAWYQDLAYFVFGEKSFFTRGDTIGIQDRAGIFSFASGVAGNVQDGTRIVII